MKENSLLLAIEIFEDAPITQHRSRYDEQVMCSESIPSGEVHPEQSSLAEIRHLQYSVVNQTAYPRPFTISSSWN